MLVRHVFPQIASQRSEKEQGEKGEDQEGKGEGEEGEEEEGTREKEGEGEGEEENLLDHGPQQPQIAKARQLAVIP